MGTTDVILVPTPEGNLSVVVHWVFVPETKTLSGDLIWSSVSGGPVKRTSRHMEIPKDGDELTDIEVKDLVSAIFVVRQNSAPVPQEIVDKKDEIDRQITRESLNQPVKPRVREYQGDYLAGLDVDLGHG